MGILKAVMEILPGVAMRIIEGIREGKSNEEIRQTISRSDVVSDEALDAARRAKQEVEDFLGSFKQ